MLLDKSYIFGQSKDIIQTLCEEKQVYLCGAFLYEVFKDKPEKRASIMNKFPCISGRPKYAVLPNINKFIEQEFLKQAPINNDLAIVLTERDFSIHHKLIDPEFNFEGEFSRVMSDKEKDVNQGTAALLKHIKDFSTMYGYLISEENDESKQEEIMVSDCAVKYIMSVSKIIFDKEMESENKKMRFPEIDKVDSNWFTYKFFQVYNLISLDIIKRYPNLQTILKSNKSKEKLRHDYLDLEYLLWALQLRGFATEEKKLKRWYQLLTN